MKKTVEVYLSLYEPCVKVEEVDHISLALDCYHIREVGGRIHRFPVRNVMMIRETITSLDGVEAGTGSTGLSVN
jgi:hypothetical protein